MRPPSRPPARPTTLVAVAAMAAALVLALAGPAGAHGDEGEMEVLVAEARSATEIYVEIGVVYASDDHLATDAGVSVTATAPDGTTVGPVEMPVVEDARYAGTVTVPAPGEWSLAVASTDPVATAAATVEVSAASPTSDAPATTEAPTTATSAPASPDGGAATVGEAAAGDDAAAGDETDTDETLGARLAVGALATVAAIGCIVGGIWWSRRRQEARARAG